MRKMIALGVGLAMALGTAPSYAQEQLPRSMQGAIDSARAAAAYGAAKADEMLAQRRKTAARFGGNPQQEFKAALAAAGRDDLDAELQVGTMYARGYGVRRNEMRAADWFVKASLHGEEAQRQATLRFSEVLRAKGMPAAEAETVAAAALVARMFGAGSGRRSGPSVESDSPTLAGEIVRDELFNGE